MVLQKPRSPKGIATRERVLVAAVARFADQGFQSTSVAEIARDARITPQAVFAHFATKELLFTAAFERDVEELLSVFSRRLASGALMNLAPGLIDELLSELDQHLLVRRVFQGREPELAADLLELPGVVAVRQQLIEQLLVGQGVGVVRSDLDATDLGEAIITLILTLLLGATQVGIKGGESQKRALASIIGLGVLAR